MYGILDGMRIIEASAFVAAPLGGMTLGQLGADVIRFDPIKGSLDARRWPITKEGKSLFWAGMNIGKRSLAIDARTPEGQEIITNLITAPGPGNGMFLTNFPARKGWMSYEELKKKREDVIMVNLLGSSDGSNAVDYTINCAAGFPDVTGPLNPDGTHNPTSHLFPAWDAIAGIHLALAMVAAERHRTRTGEGQLVKLALSDIAFAMAGHIGCLQEVEINKEVRQPYGNYLYGAYGHDFETKDGRRIYITGVTVKMWKELGKATGLAETFSAIEAKLGYDFTKEGDRFRGREAITKPLQEWCSQRTLAEITEAFKGTGVCWEKYQNFWQLVHEDPRVSNENPMFHTLEQPGIGEYLVPGSPLDFGVIERQTPDRAPILGEHTDEILTGILGMSDQEIGTLRDKGIVAGPVELSP